MPRKHIPTQQDLAEHDDSLKPARGYRTAILLSIPLWIIIVSVFFLILAPHHAHAQQYRARTTSEELKELNAVNTQFNNHLSYSRWNHGSQHTITAGNCVAFAVQKRDALIRAGWDPQRLVIWGVLNTYGRPHVVLVVDDKYVLDSADSKWEFFVVTLDYIKMQGYRFTERLRTDKRGEYIEMVSTWVPDYTNDER